MATQPSGFNEFSSDYDKVNIIDNPTYKKRKIYEKDFWLVYPSKHFLIKVGETKSFTCFLKTAGEQFGDAITPLDITSYTFKFRCYDTNNNLVIQDVATITNASAGELTYDFKALDFSSPGRYFAEIEVTAGLSIFTLPTSNKRIEIIVS